MLSNTPYDLMYCRVLHTTITKILFNFLTLIIGYHVPHQNCLVGICHSKKKKEEHVQMI
jgi:hypothetical protein